MYMPSRKQRRRRQKSFRHEYGFVTYDEEGNEVEVDPAELRPAKEKVEKSKAKPASRGGRTLREPPVPSWRRSLKRGAIWGGVMFFVVVFLFKGQSLPGRIMVGLLYAAAFVPLTYWIDRIAYRSYLRRSGKG
jgi:cytochrome c-type biogenesis protein CcmH/NrfG